VERTVSLTKLLADATGHGAEYEMLRKFRALPSRLQQEIVSFGKLTFEKHFGGLLPPGELTEAEMYRLYRGLPADLQKRIRNKGNRVYRRWEKEGRPA
jgi:hypothetical protein